MNYEFKVYRRTVCHDEHTVTINANSPAEALLMIEKGLGDYVSLDRDELGSGLID